MNVFTGSIEDWEYRPPGKPYRIREALRLRELDQVHQITHDSIVQAGYMQAHSSGRHITYPGLDTSPLTTIVIAVHAQTVIGTNSLTLDGPFGLHTDHHFAEDTDRVRAEGGRLVSSYRIATAPNWQSHCSNALVLDLIRWTFFLASRKHDFDTMLCTFNPKHERLYQRLLGARTLARRQAVQFGQGSVGAVLMRIDRENVPARFTAEIEALDGRYCEAFELAALTQRRTGSPTAQFRSH